MNHPKITTAFITNYKTPEKLVEINDPAAPGLLIKISTTGYKSFIYKYRFGKTVKRISIGKFSHISLADARKEARDLAYHVRKGLDPLALKKKAKKKNDTELTFRELTNKYVKKYLPNLRERTRVEYLRIINNELVPKFGKSVAKEIGKKEIVDILDDIAFARGAPVSSNRIRAVLSSIYSFGIDQALLEQNPVSTIKKKLKTKNGELVEKKRSRVYNDEELKNIWSAINLQIEPVQSLYKILLLCGQRSRETRRSMWENIDFKKNTWTIPAELTKPNREQIIPMSKQVREIFELLKTITGNSEYVFPSPTNINKPMDWLQKNSDKIKDVSGVKDFRIHDIRRTVTTLMAGLEIDRTVLGKVLNHKGLAGDNSVTSIYDRYDYYAEMKDAFQLWADKLDSIIDK